LAYDGSVKFDTKIDSAGFQRDLGKMKSAAKTAFTAIGAAATGAVVASAKIGIGFESAFAGVKKTVNATDDQLAKLRDGIRDMAKEIPSSANEIAGIAEAAGQLGIKTDSILSFTRVMSDLGVATNLAGDEAASTLAKFANITGMPQENFDRLGSTIVALGNNLATTEADIAAMAMRLAGAGTQVGMTEAQILSFAGALSSVGIEAEAGGSAFSRVMSDMQLAVETNSKDLKKYAKVAGMTGDQFKKSFQKDAAGAILEFVKGLNNTARNGKSATAVLADMGIEEIRLSDALKRAAGASGVFEDAVKLGSEAWEENTALAKEAEQRYATTESKIKILGNSVKDLGITAWDAFSGSFGKSIDSANDKVGDLSRAMSSGELKGALENVGALFGSLVDVAVSLASAALPPLIGILGKIGENSTYVARNIGVLSAAMLSYKAATAAANAAETISAATKTAHAAGVSGLNIAIGILNGNLTKETTLTAAKTVAEGAATAGTAAHAAAQTALNAAMSANVIGVVIASLAALGVAIGIAVANTNKETEAEKRHREQLEKTKSAIEETKKTYDDFKDSQLKSITADETKVENSKRLASELLELADANGKVNEADRARADFILGELNSSLGTEYKMVDGVIQKYQGLRDTIMDVIEAKKYEVLMSWAEDGYENYINGISEAEKNLNTIYAKNIEVIDKYLQKRSSGAEDLKEYVDQNKDVIESYTKAEDTYLRMMADRTTYETAAEIASKNGTEAAISYLEDRKSAYANASKAESLYASDSETNAQRLRDIYVNNLLSLRTQLEQYVKTGDASIKDSIENTINNLDGSVVDLQAAGLDMRESVYNSTTGDWINVAELIGGILEASDRISEKGYEIPKALGDSIEDNKSYITNSMNDATAELIDETEFAKNKLIEQSNSAFSGANEMELRFREAFGGIEQGFSNTENAPEELGTKIDDVNTKLDTAKQTASDFGVELDKLPNEVTIDVKLNVPNIPSVLQPQDFVGPIKRSYARGTQGAPGGPAVVNDGNGPELIEGKDGSFKMVQSKGAALTWLDRGDRVYTAEQTRSLMRRVPHYANGIGNGGAYSGTVEITSFIDKVPEAFDKAMDELELRRDLDVLDEEQYYAELDALKDKYFAKGSDKWWEYEKEIYNHRKETAEKAAEEAAEAELDEIERRHDLGLLSEHAYIDELTAFRDKYYAEGTEEFVEMTDKINDINRQNELDMMQYGLDIGLLTKRQYYDKLTEYRDKYFAVGSKDWLEYTKEIYQYHVDGIKAAYDELAEYAKEQLADIEAKQETLTQKLADDASFYRTVTIKNAYEDGSDMVFKELKDWAPDIEKLKRYNDALDAAKERILSGGFDEKYAKKFIDKLMEESVEDGTELAELLASASDEEFKNHLDGFAEYQKLSESTAAHQYETETEDAKKAIDAIEKECEVTISAVKELFFGSFTEALEEAGLVVPDGFFDVGEKSAEEFENGFSGSIEEAYQKIKERFNFDVVGGLAVVGDGATTTYSTFAPVYNFNVAGETTAQMIQAAEAASERNKLSGGY